MHQFRITLSCAVPLIREQAFAALERFRPHPHSLQSETEHFILTPFSPGSGSKFRPHPSEVGHSALNLP